jgi:hypothetical protein
MGERSMKLNLTAAERDAVAACLRRYLSLHSTVRDGGDITEELRDEFERNQFSPVCLIAHEEAHNTLTSQCQVCGLGRGHKGARGCLQEIEALNDYQLAAERYLAMGPGPDQNEHILSALRELILAHVKLLHSERSREGETISDDESAPREGI